MGTWGTGIYQNDSAADYLLMTILGFIKEIDTTVNKSRMEVFIETGSDSFWLETIPAKIDLLIALCKKGYLHLPETERIIGWKTKYMNGWYEIRDHEEIEPEYRAYYRNREKVLIKNFDRLIDLSQKK